VVALVVSTCFVRAAPIDIVTVLVAREDIPQWTTIREPEKLFKKVRYVKGDEPKDAITDFAALKGKRLKRDLAADQPVKPKDFLNTPPLEELLPKGTKGISLRVDPDKAVAGFVVPGCRVDVLHTLNGKSEVIAADVLLMALDLDKDGKFATATLAVKPEMTAKLATAAAGKGKFTLTLRPAKDD
jgi:Flp pilus assembly protein CpaB